MASNAGPLMEAGIHVVQSGRIATRPGYYTPGNHRLALDLQAAADEPVLDETVAELRESSATHGFLSTEELHPLHGKTEALERLRDAMMSAGFTPAVIVYLRSQARYAESIYSEYAKHGTVNDIGSYVRGILDTGRFGDQRNYRIAFDFEPMLQAFADTFGADRMLVRPYRTDRGENYLYTDLLKAIGSITGGFSLRAVNPLPLANPSVTFRTLLENIRHAITTEGALATVDDALGEHGSNALIDERFVLLSRDEMLAFNERFRESNERVHQRYGVDVNELNATFLPPFDSTHWERQRLHRAILDRALEMWGLR